jgi:hypothetical protein
LIATPTAASENPDNLEQRERANLWKSRIYCDQGYQAYLALSEAWLESRIAGVGGGVDTISAAGNSIQLHLKKLLKCFGISPPSTMEDDYVVSEPTAMELMIKLSKGKTLVARVIEQALLPPSAVQALLPNLVKSLLSSPSTSPTTIDVSDDRAFRAIALFLKTLPELRPSTLLATLQQVLRADCQHALNSMARMECVHALLLRGSNVAAEAPPVDESYAEEWNDLESKLMSILGG